MNEKKKIRRLPKRIVSFVLTIAMMLTLMPMFSTTVYAEAEDWLSFTATPGSNGTITINGESKTSATWLDTKDGNTFIVNGDTVTYNDYGGNTVTLIAVPDEGYVFDKWTSYSDTISNGDEVGNIVANFKIPEIPEHTHIWNYSVNGATLVAKCTGEGDCTVTNGKTDGVSLTLTASDANYSGSEAYTGAILENLDAFKTATGLTEAPAISYYKVETEGTTTGGTVADASTLRQTAGYYYAAVTVGTATAKAAFEVQTASPVHSHSFATEWSINSTHHWHACTGENNTEACLDEAGAAKAAHDFNNGVCSCGAKEAVQIPASELKNEIEGLALILGGDKDVMLNQVGFWLANGVRPTEAKSAAATAFMYSNFLVNNVQRGETGADLLRVVILDNLCAHKETQINLLDAIEANDNELIAAYTDEFFEVLGNIAFEISTDENKEDVGKDVIIKAESLEAFRQNAIARADASTLVSTHERYSGYMAKFCDLLNLDAHKKSVMMAAFCEWLEDEDADNILNLVVDGSWSEESELTDEVTDEILVMFAKTFYSFTAEASCLIGNVTKAVDGEGDKSIEALKTIIDEVFPIVYEVLDLVDAVENEDYANVLTLMDQCLSDEKALFEKVFADYVDYSADVQASYAALRNTTHVWTDTTHQTSTGVCLICGYTCSHTGGTATCITKAKCSVCQAEYGEYAAHNYAYSAEGNVLTAACQTDGCNDTHSLTLTASSENYSGSPATITIGTSEQRTAWTTAGLTVPEASALTYTTSTGGALEAAPTTVGSYIAKLTVGGETAQVSYTIEQAHGESTTYGHDDTNHWLTCLRSDCTEHKYGTTAHSYNETTHLCVCGKIDPNYHQHEKGTHHAAVAATCNSTGNVEYWDCTGDCGDKLDTSCNAIADVTLAIDASNHSGTATWTKTATTHKQTYNCCGAVVVAEANHVSSGAATETKAETCTVCGYEIAPKLTPSTPGPSNPTPSDPTPAPGKHYEEVAPATGAVRDITNSSEATAETNPYSASIVNSNELETLVNVTPEEKAQGVNVWIEIVDASFTMPAADKTAIQNASGDYTVGMYLDVNLFKKVGSADPIKVSDVNGKIKISVVIPENLRKAGRTFEIIRVHNGVPTVIQGTYDAATYKFTFETGQFSSYAIAYNDSDSNNGKNTTAPKTGDPYDLRAWYLLLIASLGGMLVFGGLKRKDKASK